MDLRPAHTRIAEDNPPADEVYDAVVRRGHRRRRARAVVGAGVVAVVLGAGAMAVAVAGGGTGPGPTPQAGPGGADDQTTTAPVEESATAEGPGPPVGPVETGSVSLRPADWQSSVDSGRPHAARGAGYTVTDADGEEVTVGSIGTYGEAIISAPVGVYTVTVDTLVDGTPCGFRATVTITAVDRGRPVELRCR